MQIFISYARDDDALPPQLGENQGKGFVTALREQLEYEFKRLGPPRPVIWRDTAHVEPGEQYAPIIENALKESSLLMVILSPNWMHRPFCERELELFKERWRHEGEQRVRQRIVVACKRHVDRDRRPSLLQGQQGYSFYTFEGPGQSGRQIEFFDRGAVRSKRYYDQVEELAGYLWRAVSRLSGGLPAGPIIASPDSLDPDSNLAIREQVPIVPGEPPAIRPPANGRTVYLAKPAADMCEAYDRLVQELSGHGYAIVPAPEKGVPHDTSATAFIDELLAAAEISVHLLGDEPGFAPEKTERIANLQLARAGLRVEEATRKGLAPNARFHRMIWAPRRLADELLSPEEPERDPLAVLDTFDRLLEGDKIEGGGLSSFVDFLIQHLVRTTPPLKQPPQIAADARVYLYHAREDTDYVFNLAEALRERKIETVLPVLDGPPRKVRDLHRRYLAECDAVALCWASAPEVWVRAQSSDLRDWHRLGRAKRFVYRGVVEGPPPGSRKKASKHLFPASEIDVIVDLTDKDRPLPELLDPLVPATGPGGP